MITTVQTDLLHVYGDGFKAKHYDGFALETITQDLISKEFPSASPLQQAYVLIFQISWNRKECQFNICRMLVKRIDELRVSHESRRLEAVDFKEYVGVRVANDKSSITMGAAEEIKFYR